MKQKTPKCAVCRCILHEPKPRQQFCGYCASVNKKIAEMSRRIRRNPCDREAKKYMGVK